MTSLTSAALRSWVRRTADGQTVPLYSALLRVAFVDRCIALFESPEIMLDLDGERLEGFLTDVASSLAILIYEYGLNDDQMQRIVDVLTAGFVELLRRLPAGSTVGRDFWADVVRVRHSGPLNLEQRRIVVTALDRLALMPEPHVRDSATLGLGELSS